jgi:drug/metabolite transporter (DMT)-like permease
LSLPLAAAAVLVLALAAAEKQLRGISIPAISIVEALFAQCAVSALLLWTASLVLERQPVTWSATAAFGFLISAAVMTVGGYLLFYWLLGKSGASTVSMLQWTQPLIATAESAAWMHIRPDWTAALGGVLIVAATMWAFSNRDERGVIFEITQT